MNVILIAFLVLELITVFSLVLAGYVRGLGRSVVRLCYLIVIGIVSLFGGRAIGGALGGTIFNVVKGFLPAEVLDIINQSEDLSVLLEGFVGAFLAPFCIAVLFLVIELLSLICFKLVSNKLVKATTKKDEPVKASKWFGALVGLACGIFVAAFLLSPFYMVLSAVNEVPEDTLDYFVSALGNDSYSVEAIADDSASLSYRAPLALQVNVTDSDKKMLGFVCKTGFADDVLLKLSTKNNTPKDHAYNAQNELPILAETGGEALRAYNRSIEADYETRDAILNACSIIQTNLKDSEFLRELSSDLLSALGKSLVKEKSLFGISLTTDNSAIQGIIDNLINAISKTDYANVISNMSTLFGQPMTKDKAVSLNSGSISAFLSMQGKEGEGEKPDMIHAFVNLLDNEEMIEVSEGIKNYVVDTLDDSGIDILNQENEKFLNDLVDDVSGAIQEKINDLPKVTSDSEEEYLEVVEEVAGTISGLITDLTAENDFNVSKEDVEVFSAFLAQEFTKEEHRDENGNIDINIASVLAFLNIDDIPDWAY